MNTDGLHIRRDNRTDVVMRDRLMDESGIAGLREVDGVFMNDTLTNLDSNDRAFWNVDG